MPASVISAPFLRLPSIHSLFDLSVGCSLQLTASAISVWLTGWLAHTHALSLSLSLALRSTVYRWTARTQRQRRTAPKSMLALNVNGNATKASPFSFASPLPPPHPFPSLSLSLQFASKALPEENSGKRGWGVWTERGRKAQRTQLWRLRSFKSQLGMCVRVRLRRGIHRRTNKWVHLGIDSETVIISVGE